MRGAIRGGCLAALAAAAPAGAHHSWSASYDLSRSTSLSGTVTRFHYQHPHSSIVLDVQTADGRSERWTAEWGSPQRLRERGVTERTLRAGDELTLSGNPHRDPNAKSLRVLSLRRASDGLAFP